MGEPINNNRYCAMKKHLVGLSLVASLAFVAGPSYAVGTWGGNSGNKGKLDDMVCKLAPKNPHCTGSTPAPQPEPAPHSVPEIDAANAGLALALVGGLIAIRRERRNRK
jgi:hypothetical protein